jgi:hypothetical protein
MRPVLMSAVSNTALNVTIGTAVDVRGVTAYNPSDAAAYVQLFDAERAADVTVGTTVPKASFGITTLTHFNWSEVQLYFEKGLVIAATTTVTGSNAPSASVVVNFAMS